MSQTGLSEFDVTVQKTNIWLNDLMELLQCKDRHRAYFALRTVLHALRDHLTVDMAADLGAQLPMLVRGFYYEGWRPSCTPSKERTRDQFLAHITNEFNDVRVDSEEVVRAVLSLLNKRLSEGEVSSIQHCLPSDLRTLWPAMARAT
jgi:uncharacterized protein (DUF2267 family)